MQIITFDPAEDLIFDLKAVEACRSCKRYGLTGCCPPHILGIDYYSKVLKTYDSGKIFIEKFQVNKRTNKVAIGRKSSLAIHKTLLKEREKLYKQGKHFVVILGAGSCKYCKKCVIPCRFPNLRAIPIEATGLNIVKILKRKNVNISFPVKTYFYRIGMVLYD